MDTTKTRIIEGTVMHKGNMLPTYIAQIKEDGKWRNVQDDRCYILKEGYNPLVVCKKCDWGSEQEIASCKECRGVGLRKGEPKDLRYVAEALLGGYELR